MTDNMTTAASLEGAGNIERWLAEATPEAAAHLNALAGSTVIKETRKAAKRALYLLRQRGIVPGKGDLPAAIEQPTTAHEEDLRAWASAYDGAGNRLLLLVLKSPDGGASTVAQILANDELGIRDLSLERKRLREIEPLMTQLEERIDGGLAIAEIEPEYARALLDRFRTVNLKRRKTTPAGFVDLLPRIGAPSQTAGSFVQNESGDGGGAADSEVQDPADLFKLTWFEPWFFAAEDVTPWLERWIEASAEIIVSPDQDSEAIQQSIAREAAEGLIAGRLRGLYITRLEESGDILRRRGRETEARQAFFHARALKSDAPIGDIPFAVALAARTLEAAVEMVAAAQRKQAGEAAAAGE